MTFHRIEKYTALHGFLLGSILSLAHVQSSCLDYFMYYNIVMRCTKIYL